jgi:hypothetical protein
MAARRRVGTNPAVRGIVRDGVRAGAPRRDIIDEVTTRFPGVTPQRVGQLVSEEGRRQAAVDRLTAADKRRSIDVPAEMGCRGGNGRLRMSVTVSWTDPRTGVTRTFGTTVETAGRGRLADILNDALSQVTDAARARGYDPGRITSAQTAGRTSYRINYVDCL